jgi:hypothetical protein
MSGRFLPETPPGRCCIETLRFPSASEKRHFSSQVKKRLIRAGAVFLTYQ